MDLLSSLPVPVRSANSAPGRSEPAAAGSRPDRDSQVQESAGATFSGLLERQQERPEPRVSGREARTPKPAADKPVLTEGMAGQAADNRPAVALPTPAAVAVQVEPSLPGNPLMIGQMVKVLQEQQVAAAPRPLPGPNQGSTATAPVQNPENVPGGQIALTGFKPTGGDGQVTAQVTPALAPAPGSGQAAPVISEAAPSKDLPGTTTATDRMPVPASRSATPVNLPAPAGQAGTSPIPDPGAATTNQQPGTPAPGAPGVEAVPSPRQDHLSGAPGTAVPTGPAEAIQTEAGKQGTTAQAHPVQMEGGPAPLARAVTDQQPDASGKDTQPGQPPVAMAPVTETTGKTAPAEQAVTAGDLDQTVPVEPVEMSGRGVRVRPEISLAGPSTRSELLEQGRLIRSQVVRELSGSLTGIQGGEKVSLQLNPENLGRVDIQFLARGNDLNIVITADGKQAQQALREGVKELAEVIADRSGRWNQVDIKIEQRGQEQNRNDSRQDPRREQSGRDGREDQQQQQQQQQRQNQGRGTGPDWASLRAEG